MFIYLYEKKETFMKKILQTILVLIIAVIFGIVMTGCKSGGDVETKTDVKKKTDAPELNLPDWFLTPPNAEDMLYAVGFSKKTNPQMALVTAADWARQELARVVSVKVSTMTKQFLEEAGVENQTQASEFSQVVSKSLASEVISGSKIDKQELKPSQDKYAAYVLIKLSLADMGGKIDAILKANSAAFAKLQANKAFDDLAKELKDMEADKYDKSNRPVTE
jgi:hypothetical protein